MYLSIFKKKIISIKVFTMFFLFSMFYLGTTVYAAVPYTYTPIPLTHSIEVKFDYDLTNFNPGKITVYQTTAIGGLVEQRPSTVLRPLNITVTSLKLPSNTLNIKIDTLDPSISNYAIKIGKQALTFTNYIPLTDFILPFSSTDFGSGFKTIFMSDAGGGLADIFKYNSMRDVSIYVPKKYITSIETIHKAGGLTTTETNYPKLTNIDIITDASVKRLKVSITELGTDTYLMQEKELLPSSGLSGFTTGVEGLNIDTTPDYTFNVRAYDANGRLLEDSKFNQKSVDVTTDTVSKYVVKTNTSSNKTLTLYELMKNPTALASLVSSTEPDNLDEIKVMYPNDAYTRFITNTEGQVNDAANVLAKALTGDGSDLVQYIRFASVLTITPIQTAILARADLDLQNPRHIVLDGSGSTINGDLIVGRGDSNVYDLRNITINGDLTINLSPAGQCLLTNNVTVKGRTIVNGTKSSEVIGVASMEDKTSYKIGDTVRVGVKFNEPVFATGALRLNLSNSGINVRAVYDAASTDAVANKDIVVFKYVVVMGEANDFDLQTGATAIDLNGGIIQPRNGSSTPISNFTGANSKMIYTSNSKENITVDSIMPDILTPISIVSNTNPEIISANANDILDEASAEIAANWKVKDIDTGKVYTPQVVNLDGNKKTVKLVMPIDFLLTDISKINISIEGVKDKAGNMADHTSPTGALTFSKAGVPITITSVRPGDIIRITATFNEPLAYLPIVKIAGVGPNLFGPVEMQPGIDAYHYTYDWTVGQGTVDGPEIFKFSAGTDIATNDITTTPTSGTLTINNTAPAFLPAFAVDNSVQPNTIKITAVGELNLTSIKSIANWKVTNGSTITYSLDTAALQADKKTVLLTLKPVDSMMPSTFITTVDAPNIVITPGIAILDTAGNSYVAGAVTEALGTLNKDIGVATFINVAAISTNSYYVFFDELMDKATANDKGNYTISGSGTNIYSITNAELQAGGKSVKLTISGALTNVGETINIGTKALTTDPTKSLITDVSGLNSEAKINTCSVP
ncbi:hypothetical protein LGL08_05290 [Clostridium estertheticum]|uniref:hypothetical protein n=1 Tax=Clostridium estertheticum TaxID=238834 RepID=UPI001CF0DED5|nr:hypothetical protein [Clostridium estertheticum]MCB2306055.1 hypothetical protein [Clostridium estertheticum]MCB2346578.1 hypothetical protein [Clostridium estertheticum]MCB2348974.1 hypothetical protein [Clostridium estertheticum]WAG47615.1 hypothetical protein LL127_09325 [Clostridium estertheticum]